MDTIRTSQKVILSVFGLSFLVVYAFFWWPWLLLDFKHLPWLIPFNTFVIVPLLDRLCGDITRNLTADEEQWVSQQQLFRWLPILVLPVFLAYQFVIAGYFIDATSWVSKLGWLVTASIAGTTMAINIGHELIHRKSKLEQNVGGVLLSSVAYGGFKIEHIYGHHVNVATPEDLTTAPLGMSVYRFWLRTLARTPISAFKLAQKRKIKRGQRFNEAVVLGVLSLLFLSLYTAVFGTIGLVYWLLQSLGSILFLETVNYIEHYGLLRKQIDGKYERISHHHSWNSSKAITNALLFNLQRHSDHHAHASRPYMILRHFDDSPQMPAGYAAMILLSFVPPIWFRVMDKKMAAEL